jgi:hypothetical protein
MLNSKFDGSLTSTDASKAAESKISSQSPRPTPAGTMLVGRPLRAVLATLPRNFLRPLVLIGRLPSYIDLCACLRTLGHLILRILCAHFTRFLSSRPLYFLYDFGGFDIQPTPGSFESSERTS